MCSVVYSSMSVQSKASGNVLLLQALREETQNDWAGCNTNYRTPTYSAHAWDEHMLAAVFSWKLW